MDYNRVYQARYLNKVAGVTAVDEIAEQAGLSREQVYNAISDDITVYTDIKADFTADAVTGEYSRKYDIPKPVTLQGEILDNSTDRYFRLLTQGHVTLDIIKSYLINDDVRGSQIASILKDLGKRLREYRAEDLNEIAESLLAVEQLPLKWTVDRKTLTLADLYPSPMVSKDGYLHGVKYTRERIEWRRGLPPELARAVFLAEHPLDVDGHKLLADADTWGEREYSILGARGRGPGFYTRLADYMGYTIEEFAGYRAKIQKYRKTQANAEKEKAELTDSFKLEQRVSQLLADYVAKGGDLSRRRNSREETAE